MAGARQEISIDAPVENVFEVITDYERYCDFLPEIKRAEIISRNEDALVVCFELEIVMRLSYTLELRQEKPHSVKWTLKEAKMMSSNDGLWHLRPQDDGGTHATYEVDVCLPGLIPKSISDRLTGVTLPQTLQRFKERCEALAGAERE